MPASSKKTTVIRMCSCSFPLPMVDESNDSPKDL